MADKPRQKELENKVFKDEDGKPYQGQRLIGVLKHKNDSQYEETEVWYKDGKIHGKPAIIYPDGLQEYWEDGKFMGVILPPFGLR